MSLGGMLGGVNKVSYGNAGYAEQASTSRFCEDAAVRPTQPPSGELVSFCEQHAKSIEVLRMEVSELRAKLSPFLRQCGPTSESKTACASGPSEMLGFIAESANQIAQIASELRELRERVTA